jgi:hypothetical protein
VSDIDETRPRHAQTGRHRRRELLGIGIPDRHGTWHRVICDFSMTCVSAPDVLHPEVTWGIHWPSDNRVEVLTSCAQGFWVGHWDGHGIHEGAELTHDLCGFCRWGSPTWSPS